MAGVYVYWFPSRRAAAEAAGQFLWDCKVGFTARCALARVKEQCTSVEEAPEIGLVIASPRARELEHAIHVILRLRGRALETYPGREWFRTSPDEVAAIYRYVVAGADGVPRGEEVLRPPFEAAAGAAEDQPAEEPVPPAPAGPEPAPAPFELAPKLAAAARTLQALDVAEFALEMFKLVNLGGKGGWHRLREKDWVRVGGESELKLLLATEVRGAARAAAEAAEAAGSPAAGGLHRLAARLGQRNFAAEVAAWLADMRPDPLSRA